jgi:hypothetical protein
VVAASLGKKEKLVVEFCDSAAGRISEIAFIQKVVHAEFRTDFFRAGQHKRAGNFAFATNS